MTKPTTRLGKALAFALCSFGLMACYARARVGEEECRTVEVRNPHALEVCHTHCDSEGCRERCRERARYARERRCWVD